MLSYVMVTSFFNYRNSPEQSKKYSYNVFQTGAYLRKIVPMASTKIAFYIYYLLIISPVIHVYVYYVVFAKLLQENYLKNIFRTFQYGNIKR
jgi:hypothetical protein